MAQRAFTTYLRGIHVRADKTIFDVTQLPHAEYAASLGLPTTPRIRFLKRGVKGGKNIQGSEQVTTHFAGQVPWLDMQKIVGSFFVYLCLSLASIASLPFFIRIHFINSAV